MLAIIIHEKYVSDASKTDTALTGHRLFADLMPKQTQQELTSSLPSSEGSSFWNQFQIGCVFQDNKSRIRGTRASFRRWSEQNCEEQGPRSTVLAVLSMQKKKKKKNVSY